MRNFFAFILLLFMSSLASGASLENSIIQTKIRDALSQRYPTGDVDIRLCTYGECIYTTLIDAEHNRKTRDEPSDAAEVSLIITTIFSSAGQLLRPDSRVNVSLKRYEKECQQCEGERKVIEADIVLGAGTCT